MPDPLEAVTKAATSKRRAEDSYRAALAAAVAELERADARDPFAQVARAAGVSRQAVRQLLGRRS